MAQYGMKAGSKPFMVEHLHRVWRATNVTNQSQDSGMEHRDERAPLCNTDIVEDCIVKCLREQNIYENILQYKVYYWPINCSYFAPQEINLSAAMESLKGSVKCNKKSLQDVLEKQVFDKLYNPFLLTHYFTGGCIYKSLSTCTD